MAEKQQINCKHSIKDTGQFQSLCLPLQDGIYFLITIIFAFFLHLKFEKHEFANKRGQSKGLIFSFLKDSPTGARVRCYGQISGHSRLVFTF